MSITSARKAELVNEYGTGTDADTGSPEVQVAILSDADRQPDRTPQGPTRRTTTRAAAC